MSGANSYLALVPIFLATNITLGPHLSFTDLYWIISVVVTTSSTLLIVHQILRVRSRSTNGNNESDPYHSTIEILVESGALYTATILVCGIFVVTEVFETELLWLYQVTQYLTATQITIAVSSVPFLLDTLRN
ncbi:hypothetical protein HYPSUDRAFT_37764 [Hypholoma sublateritium FD-334 SS-4]|uniref:Uncharacterized protein n=1 Tax=Hypholoma sublateritium (strain FD-334 SS-4) TaxID=945553 RepID=A0A0D2P9L3_HYPSF|nr:hypothetical protein HYPSUDRAFT_37764 [Hypholoma sublateritium FD-334 SS-4]